MRYRSVSVEGPFNTTTVFTKEANLTGLIKDESYNVSVLATTVKGNGPYSVPKEFTTNEDSKYFLLGNDQAMFFFFLSTFVWDHRKSVSTAKKNVSVNISEDAKFERDLLKSTQKPLYKTSQLCTAISPLAFNLSLLNLVSFLILRRSFQRCQ